MKIRYITCSDLRECVPHDDAVNLLRISPRAELGIQAHPKDMEHGQPRHVWMEKLVKISEFADGPLNIAVHVNYNWCTDMCNGVVAPELRKWLDSQNRNNGAPTIRRWQLNIGFGTGRLDEEKIARLVEEYRDREWIFPFNKNTAENIAVLKRAGVPFSLLFDASGGAGRSPDSWRAPVYDDIPQGYSGGLGPDNVRDNLDRISAVVPIEREIWIDAEGRLMKPGTREFDRLRGAGYINRALCWEKSRGA